MQDVSYQTELDSITKSLEKAIEMEWLTKNEHIRLEAISHSILGDLHSLKRNIERDKRISEALSSLQEYMPEMFEKVLKALEEKEMEGASGGDGGFGMGAGGDGNRQ